MFYSRAVDNRDKIFGGLVPVVINKAANTTCGSKRPNHYHICVDRCPYVLMTSLFKSFHHSCRYSGVSAALSNFVSREYVSLLPRLNRGSAKV